MDDERSPAEKPGDPADTGLQLVADTPAPKRRLTLSLRFLMAAGFGGLIAISVGTVLAVTIYANAANTFELLNKRAVELIETMEYYVDRDAEEAKRVVAAVAKHYARGSFEIDDLRNAAPILETLLMSEPVVEIIDIIDRDGHQRGVIRTQGDGLRQMGSFPGDEERRPTPGRGGAPDGEGPRQAGRDNDGPPEAGWTRIDVGTVEPLNPSFLYANEPTWIDPVMRDGRLFHAVIQTLSRDGQAAGVVVGLVGGRSFNRTVSSIAVDNLTTAFVLDGKGRIIGHSAMPQQFQAESAIELSAFPDPPLSFLGKELSEGTFFDELGEGDDVRVGLVDGPTGIDEFVFITKDITSMTRVPYTLGAYFSGSAVETEVRRMLVSALIGFGALIFSVILAIVLGTRLSRPLRGIAQTATRFSALELEPFKPMKRSRVREIDNQALAMNAMHAALSQVIRYLPRDLVKRLMDSGEEAGRSVEREITVMFTDVAGFTGIAEHLSARETVAMLNEHFGLVGAEIVATRGTVDKFMGDGLMAFWGAPLADDDHAAHAIAAARRIVDAISAFNAEREAGGLPALRMRIGIHTGRAVIGNIGGGERQNYTVVGDVVNVASRLEQLGKEIGDGGAVTVLVSEQARAAAGGGEGLRPVGSHLLRGRARPILIHVLDPDGAAAASGPDRQAAGAD